MFDSSYTTKEERMGIGLYMCKAIVEDRMNGCIRVENSHEGAELKIIVPFVSAKSEIK